MMIKKNSEFDVIIAGGGPAGLSALLWCAELSLSAILFEKGAEFGGQLLRTHNEIGNYLGIEAANGRDLCDRFLSQIETTSSIQRFAGVEIVEANLVHKTVTLENGAVYSSRAIILATGVRRRKLMVPGEEEFSGQGILESGIKARDDVRGKTVLIFGGGDAALENATILSETAGKIFVAHRRREFTARKEFLRKAEELENIEFLTDTKVLAIVGNEMVEAADLQHLSSGKLSRVHCDAVLIRIGVEPNTELFRGQVKLDDAGYVTIDRNCATNLQGVFAVGDAANPTAPTLNVATGHGAVAVNAIFKEIYSR